MSTLPFLTLEDFGVLKDATPDLFILVPHGQEYTQNSDFSELFTGNLCPDQEALKYFCRMDADIGSVELSRNIAQILEQKGYSTRIATFQIPRSLLDINRPFERCLAKFLTPSSTLQAYYQKLQEGIYREFARAKTSFHCHTMASFDRVELWEPCKSNECTLEAIQSYAKRAYSGRRRAFNILSGNAAGEIFTPAALLYQAQEKLISAGYDIQQNQAYSLEANYPTTQFIKQFGGLAVDITKRWIATPETAESIDPAAVIVDDGAISKLAEVFAAIFREEIKNPSI